MFRGKQAKGPVQLERLRKWNESCWKGTIFSTFVIVATIVSFHEKWFTDTRWGKRFSTGMAASMQGGASCLHVS